MCTIPHHAARDVAWLTESSIFRLDQIPERHLQKFLSCWLCPTRRNRRGRDSQLRLAHDRHGLHLSAGTQFVVTHEGSDLPLRTLSDVHLNNVQLEQLLLESDSIEDVTRRLEEGFPLLPFGAGPDAADTMYFGFSALPTSATLSIGIALDSADSGPAQRRAIREGARAAQRMLRANPADIDCGRQRTSHQS